MKIQIETIENDIQLVTISGEINTTTAPKVTEKIKLLATEKVKIIFDMTEVSYMSSAGLRTLLSIYRQVTKKEGQILLIGLSEEIEDTMSITGFLKFFKTAKNLDEGKKQLQ